jgi:hypothetical protein
MSANVNPSNLVSGFLQSLWTEGMLKYAEKQFMLKNLVTDFTSLAGEGASIVKVPLLSEPTVADAPTNSTALTFQADDDAVGTITLDSHPYEARRIEDIAQAQASSDLFELYSKSLGYAVAKGVEAGISGIISADTTNTVIDTEASDVMSTAKLVAGFEVMLSKNVDPVAGDLYLAVSSGCYGDLLQEEEFTHALKRGDGTNPNVSGALGMILGMPVYIDNNLTSNGADGTITACMFHRSSTGFAYAIEPRVQSQYNLEHIAHDVVADCVYGCDVLNGNLIQNFANV